MVCFRVVKTYYYTSVGSSSLHCFVLDALLGGGAYASSAANISRRYRSCFEILCVMTERENKVFSFRTSWNIICVITTNAGTF